MYGTRGYNRENIHSELNRLRALVKVYETGDDAVAITKENYEKIARSAQERENRNYAAWMNCLDDNKKLKAENRELNTQNRKLKKDCRDMEKKETIALRKLRVYEEKTESLTEKWHKSEEKIKTLKENAEEKDREIEALKEEILRLKARLDNDGTTSGIPTSKTPEQKKKVIPNSREKSDQNKGGQPGHEKKVLDAFDDAEIDATEIHETKACPKCGGKLEETGADEERDVADYEVKIIKHRHVFKGYRCTECGATFHTTVPHGMKARNQYGPATQAMALSLLNQGFVSVGRTREMIGGLLGGEISPSTGYIGSITKKYAKRLKKFIQDVKDACVKQRILYWDDTVIFINTVRGCMRFYGNERIALYVAHEKKDAHGINEDGILSALTAFTYLMHDHIKYNYRKEFLFQNIECIQHLERELQKVYNESGHKWALELKELISNTLHRRKELKKSGAKSFSDEETRDFEGELKRLMDDAAKAYERDGSRYYHNDEKNAIAKVRDYKDNYFAWVYDFSLPATNNLSERSLRMTKTKQKVSGQFGTVENASAFADIRTYIETCRRNGKDAYEALKRLTSGKPYTVAELLAVD